MDQLATTIVGGLLSQSSSALFWVQTQSVFLSSPFSYLHSPTTLQHRTLLCTPLWNPCRPGTPVLEAPQPPSQFCSPSSIYTHGSLHPRRGHRFLRQRYRPPGAAHHNWCIPGLDTLHLTEQGNPIVPCTRHLSNDTLTF
jgi:hypothetical protein